MFPERECNMSYSTIDHARVLPLFGDQIVSKGLWLPHAPDFHHEILLLWSYVKYNAYHNNTRNLDESKPNISNITADISPVALQAVSMDMFRRARLCMQHAGENFQ
jgi:hypothetical protein